MNKQGVLLAVSSLPGKYGVGDFSNEAFEFIDILFKNKIDVWQILPLNPIGYGHSPYQPFSSFAIDEIYISIEDLKDRGLFNKIDPIKQEDKTNYELARKIKENAIESAFSCFCNDKNNIEKLNKFLAENKYINEYVEYITLKELNNNKEWSDWSDDFDFKDDEINHIKMKHAFAQFILIEEWNKIRKYANDKNIKIIGDLPFYVGYDSSDVYFHKESFYLDKENKPSCVAGVPPDYFSEYGQRWGNPIWNWEYLYKNDFKLIFDRIIYASKLYDIVRLDHFRAFDSYWSINPECDTAIDGEWKYPDGYLFFDTLFKKYPGLNIIAEDLGDLRPEVIKLKNHYNLAGMQVLEFSIFDDLISDKSKEIENQIYYVGTHDNETLVEWLNKLETKEKTTLLIKMIELKIPGNNLAEKLINYALKRKEKLVVIPISDILMLDKEHRMNEPSTVNEHNWTFKLKEFDGIIQGLERYFKGTY